MKKAVITIREAAKTGAEITEETRRLAAMYKNVPSYAKVMSKINEGKIGKVRQWLNNTLGTAYFNLQGGVAVKNLTSNNVLIGVDEGTHAFIGFDDVIDATGVKLYLNLRYGVTERVQRTWRVGLEVINSPASLDLRGWSNHRQEGSHPYLAS